MPYIRSQFFLPTAQATPQIAEDTNRVYENLASQYQQRYDAAMESESELINMMGNSLNDVREKDRPFMQQYMVETEDRLRKLGEEAPKGFTLPKIKREAGKFTQMYKPLSDARRMEMEEIAKIDSQNFTPEEKARRIAAVKNKETLKYIDNEPVFNYNPTSYADRPDITSLLMKNLSRMRPNKSFAWNNSRVITVGVDGIARDGQGNKVNFDQSTPGKYRVSSQGSSKKITVEELKEASRDIIKSDPDTSRFIQEEIETRMFQNPDMDPEIIQEQVMKEYTDDAVSNVASMLDFNESTSGSSVDYMGGISHGDGEPADSEGYNYRAYSSKSTPMISSKISGLDADKLKDTDFKQTGKPKMDPNSNMVSALGSIGIFENIEAKKGPRQIPSEERKRYEQFLSSDMAKELGYTGDPKDIHSQEAIDIIEKYNNISGNVAFSVGYRTFDRLGEKGRSKREDLSKDVNSILPDLTVWSEQKGRVLTFNEKKELLKNNNLAIGENSAENMFTEITGNDSFATSYSVDSFGKDGSLKDRLIVADQSSDQDSNKGKTNRSVNKVFRSLNTTPGLWVEMQNAVGNNSVNVRSVIDLQNGKISHYEIQGIDYPFKNVSQVLQFIKNARGQN